MCKLASDIQLQPNLKVSKRCYVTRLGLRQTRNWFITPHLTSVNWKVIYLIARVRCPHDFYAQKILSKCMCLLTVSIVSPNSSAKLGT